jgi:hypothetical protein
MGFLNFDDVKINSVAAEMEMPVNTVQCIYDLYKSNIDDHMGKQYLAHSIRAIEQFAYDMHKPIYIRHWSYGCVPCYVETKTHFHIYYPDTSPPDSKRIRMEIAHELGHLFFNTNAHNENGVYEWNGMMVEDVANIFGLLLLLGRRALYSGKKDVFGGMSEDDIIKEYAVFCGEMG